jgi:hypothetical protein
VGDLRLRTAVSGFRAEDAEHPGALPALEAKCSGVEGWGAGMIGTGDECERGDKHATLNAIGVNR